MITEKDLENTRYFTSNGTDFWRNVHVRTIRQVMLVNIETGDNRICEVGADEPFIAIRMPETNVTKPVASKPAKKNVRGPYKKRGITSRKAAERIAGKAVKHIAGHRGPLKKVSQHKGGAGP